MYARSVQDEPSDPPAQEVPTPGPVQRLAARVKRRFLRWSGRLRKAARWTATGSVAVLAILSGIYPAASTVPFVLDLVLALAMLGIVAAPLPFVLSQIMLLLPGRKAHVDASNSGLVMAIGKRERTVTAEDIVLAVVVPGRKGAELRVTLSSGDEYVVTTDSVAAADALLAALALDPHRHRVDLEWNPWAARIGGAMTGFLTAACTLSGAIIAVDGTRLVVPVAFLFIVAPFLAAGYFGRRVGHRVSIGSDGVWAKHGFGKAVQLHMGEVRSVSSDGTHLVFERVSGEPVRVSLADLDPARQALLLSRAQQALARFAELAGSRAEPFVRGVRSFDEWKQAITALLPKEVTFRSAAMRREDALRVVEDPTAPADARVGAALALMNEATDDERLRVRVAADSSAYPKVRVALEAALEGEVDEDLVEEAQAERSM